MLKDWKEGRKVKRQGSERDEEDDTRRVNSDFCHH